jgi:ADP-ribose pyrophosphatase YjhB (NUDIX family)
MEWRPREAGQGGAAAPIITVGAAIFHPTTGDVLMFRTHKWSGLWGIPGGKVRLGERCIDALRRELKEETNLDVSDIAFVLVQDCIGSKEFYRDAHFVLLNYRCRALEPIDVQLNEEAQEFRWLPLGKALELELNTPTKILLEALKESETWDVKRET